MINPNLPAGFREDEGQSMDEQDHAFDSAYDLMEAQIKGN